MTKAICDSCEQESANGKLYTICNLCLSCYWTWKQTGAPVPAVA